MRSHVKNKTGRKVTLLLTAPTGKRFTVHSYKSAAAMVNRKADSLRVMASQHGGTFMVGGSAPDERWLIEKLAR